MVFQRRRKMSSSVRSGGLIMSLNETGVARLIFAKDFSRFDGALVNLQNEILELHGTPSVSSTPGGPASSLTTNRKDVSPESGPCLQSPNSLAQPIPINIESDQVSIVSNSSGSKLVDINISPPTSNPDEILPHLSVDNECLFDIIIIEGETGSQYFMKRVKLSWEASEQGCIVSLDSDHVHFTTEEILVGNRADLDARTYLTPDLAGLSSPLHVGKMNIHFRAAVTPPPTPASSTCDGEPMDEGMAHDELGGICVNNVGDCMQ